MRVSYKYWEDDIYPNLHITRGPITMFDTGDEMQIGDGVKGKTPEQFYDFSGMSIDETMEAIRANNIRLGWEDKERSFDEWSNLFYTEITEAYEEHRAGHGPTEVYYSVDSHGFDKPEGIPVEYADEVIRIMHFFAFHGMSLADMISLKMNYNRIRQYRHGNKVS